MTARTLTRLTLLLPLVAACTTPPAPLARIQRSDGKPWPTHEHDLSYECPHIPEEHSEFTQLMNYPRTLKTWKDEEKLGTEGPRHVVIDLAIQRGFFIINDEVVMDFPVCTGTKHKPTPRGTFRITQKNVDHVSNIYDVPMPYFMRLTNYGIGLHVGDVFRSPASHGCIRMTREACVPLYHNAPSGTRVVIR